MEKDKEKLQKLRHSLAHILAAVIQKLYPKAKFGIGPATEDGFFYEFKLEKISDEDLPKIEKEMRELIKKNLPFEKKVVSKKEAKEIFKDQPFKLQLLEEIKDEKVTLYKVGNFLDLCQGPHLKSTSEIDPEAFKLSKIAGAYWKGDEKNPMLTRIYGIAFLEKKELEEYLEKIEEAKKRDHRILGKKLELFFIDEEIGPGLVLWQEKGAILRRIIENFVIEEYLKNGYFLVSTPHIARKILWEKSGHLEFYKENMFPPMHLKEISKEEKGEYQLRPMNCPFHIAIFKQKIRSYRDLPLRYAEIAAVYRYERSGTLHGLTRVRGLTQDDGHIFCTPSQLGEELVSLLNLTLKILKTFGFNDFSISLSTRPKKYIGDEKIWKKAENALKYALEKTKLSFEILEGEGAFYGPKIDLHLKDSLQREWQCSTIQVDFNLPQRFELYFINQKGKKETPIMIHRAILGSIERFIGILLEHYGGDLPLWLSPIQIWIIPVGASHREYATQIEETLKKEGFRAEAKNEAKTVAKKIREGEIQKIPYLLVVGDREKNRKTVRVRKRKEGDIGEFSLSSFIEKLKKELPFKIN